MTGWRWDSASTVRPRQGGTGRTDMPVQPQATSTPLQPHQWYTVHGGRTAFEINKITP